MSHAEFDQPRDAEYSNEPGGAASQAVETIDMTPLDLGDPDTVQPDQAGAVPRAVTRLSCVHCRKKKLKCNRAWPLCARCKTLKQDCIYPASKQHNSGRRRQVKGPTDKSGQYQGSWVAKLIIELIMQANSKTKSRKLSMAPGACDMLVRNSPSQQQILMKRKTSRMKSVPALQQPLVVSTRPRTSLRLAGNTMP